MAKTIDPVKVLNIDEVPYAVDSMSDAVKEQVEVFNGWNQDEANLLDEVRKIRAAKNDLSRQIIMQVRKEKEEAEAEVAAAAAAEAPNTDDAVSGEDQAPSVD